MRITTVLGVVLLAPAAHGQVVAPPAARPAGFRNIAPPPTREFHGRVHPDQTIRDHALGSIDPDDRARSERLGRRRQIAREFRGLANPILERDESGRVVLVAGSKHAVALDRNPLITDQAVLDRCHEIREERTTRLFDQLVANVDLMVEFDGGALDGLSISDRSQMSRARHMMKTLSLGQSLADDLDDAGVLDERQDAMLYWMVNNYDEAARRDLIEAGREQRPSADASLARYLLHDGISECRVIYDDVLRIASDHLVEIGEARPPEVVQAFADAAARVAQVAPDERIDVVRDLMNQLPKPEQQALLRAAWAKR